MSHKLMASVAAIAVGATLVASCGSATAGDSSASGNATTSGDQPAASESVIVGSADFAESQLIAVIYSHALSKAGVKVQEKLNIGSREVYIQALKDGSIDLIPEYNGTLLAYLNPKSNATTPEDVTKQLNAAMPDGIIALDASTAQDRDVLAVKADFAKKNNLKNISDLAPLAADMVLAGPAEWKSRFLGVPGLKQLYGLEFKKFQVFDAGGPLTLAALTNGQAQAGDMFSSDPAIQDNGLVALKDDKGLFGEAAILPIIRESKATDTVKTVLNKISAALNEDDLVAMNGQLNKGEDLEKVADEWLSKHSL